MSNTINWRGDNNVIDGFINGLAKFQIDYNPFHKEWVLYGPGVDPNGEAFSALGPAKSYAENLK